MTSISRKLSLLLLLTSIVIAAIIFVSGAGPRKEQVLDTSYSQDEQSPALQCQLGTKLSDQSDKCLKALFERARVFDPLDTPIPVKAQQFRSTLGEHVLDSSISFDRILYLHGYPGNPRNYQSKWHVYIPLQTLSNGTVVYKIDQSLGPESSLQFHFEGTCSLRNVTATNLAGDAVKQAVGEPVDKDSIALNAFFEEENNQLTAPMTLITQGGDSIWSLVERILTQRFGKDFQAASTASKNGLTDSFVDNFFSYHEDNQYVYQNFRAQFGNGFKSKDLIYTGYRFYVGDVLGQNYECFWTAKTESGRGFIIFRDGTVREIFTSAS